MSTLLVRNHLPHCLRCSTEYASFSNREKAFTETLCQLYLFNSLKVPFLNENQLPPRHIQEAINSFRERAIELFQALNISNSSVYGKIAHHAFECHSIQSPPIATYTITIGPSKKNQAAL